MFDWKKPTVQMLGRWQPWHDGHQALFKRCIAKTGQVAIQVRDVQGASGGDCADFMATRLSTSACVGTASARNERRMAPSVRREVSVQPLCAQPYGCRGGSAKNKQRYSGSEGWHPR